MMLSIAPGGGLKDRIASPDREQPFLPAFMKSIAFDWDELSVIVAANYKTDKTKYG